MDGLFTGRLFHVLDAAFFVNGLGDGEFFSVLIRALRCEGSDSFFTPQRIETPSPFQFFKEYENDDVQ